jgi:hypothetical protein
MGSVGDAHDNAMRRASSPRRSASYLIGAVGRASRGEDSGVAWIDGW